MQARTCFWSLAALLCLVPGAALLAEEVARPTVEAPPVLPPAWQTVPPQDRLGAVRVAEVDADRLLMERIYGLHVDADTLVMDLALDYDEIRGWLLSMIRGVRTKEVKYNDDLSVEVVREVTIREVVETIHRIVSREETRFTVKVDQVESISRQTHDTVLAVMGNGAVAGSLGQKRIQAKRAAEMDCYRRLAERALGVRISADTTVRNFVLANDRVLTDVAGCLAGVKFTDIAYGEGGTCKVTGRLVLRDLIASVERSYKRFVKDGRATEDDWQRVRLDSRDTVIVETGEGVPQPEGREVGVPAAVPGAYFYQRTIIERIARQEVGGR
jgi:hypothetical protein